MKKIESPLFAESIKWIKEHPLATTHDVPIQLIRDWSYDKESDLAPSSFYLSIFTFGYCQRQIVSSNTPAGHEFSVTSNRLLELFLIWQLKLGLMEVHRNTDLRVGALPLFDFPPNESVTYYSEKVPGSA